MAEKDGDDRDSVQRKRTRRGLQLFLCSCQFVSLLVLLAFILAGFVTHRQVVCLESFNITHATVEWKNEIVFPTLATDVPAPDSGCSRDCVVLKSSKLVDELLAKLKDIFLAWWHNQPLARLIHSEQTFRAGGGDTAVVVTRPVPTLGTERLIDHLRGSLRSEILPVSGYNAEPKLSAVSSSPSSLLADREGGKEEVNMKDSLGDIGISQASGDKLHQPPTLPLLPTDKEEDIENALEETEVHLTQSLLSRDELYHASEQLADVDLDFTIKAEDTAIHLVKRALTDNQSGGSSSSSSSVIGRLQGLLHLLKVTSAPACGSLLDMLEANCESHIRSHLKQSLFRPAMTVVRDLGVIHNHVCVHNGTEACETAINCSVLNETVGDAELTAARRLELLDAVKQAAAAMCSADKERFIAATIALQTSEVLTVVLREGVAAVNFTEMSQDPMCFRDVFMIKKLRTALLSAVETLPTLASQGRDLIKTLDYGPVAELIGVTLPTRVAAVHKAMGFVNKTDKALISLETTKALTCQALFPHPQYKSCSWLCHNFTSVVRLHDAFAVRKPPGAPPSLLRQLFGELASVCANSQTYTQEYCLDPACGNSNSICRHRPLSSVKSAEHSSKLVEAVARRKAVKSANSLCINLTCPFPLSPTTDASRVEGSVEYSLRAAFGLTSVLFPGEVRYSKMAMPCARTCTTGTLNGEDMTAIRPYVRYVAWSSVGLAVVTFVIMIIFHKRLAHRSPVIMMMVMIVLVCEGLAYGLQDILPGSEPNPACHTDGTLRTDVKLTDVRCLATSAMIIFAQITFPLFCLLLSLEMFRIVLGNASHRYRMSQKARKVSVVTVCVMIGLLLCGVAAVLVTRPQIGVAALGVCLPKESLLRLCLPLAPAVVVCALSVLLLIFSEVVVNRQRASIKKSQQRRAEVLGFLPDANRLPPQRLDRRVTNAMLTRIIIIPVQIVLLISIVWTASDYVLTESVQDRIVAHLQCATTSCSDEGSKKCPPLPRTEFFLVLVPLKLLMLKVILFFVATVTMIINSYCCASRSENIVSRSRDFWDTSPAVTLAATGLAAVTAVSAELKHLEEEKEEEEEEEEGKDGEEEDGTSEQGIEIDCQENKEDRTCSEFSVANTSDLSSRRSSCSASQTSKRSKCGSGSVSSVQFFRGRLRINSTKGFSSMTYSDYAESPVAGSLGTQHTGTHNLLTLPNNSECSSVSGACKMRPQQAAEASKVSRDMSEVKGNDSPGSCGSLQDEKTDQDRQGVVCRPLVASSV